MSPWTITMASFSSLSTLRLYNGHIFKPRHPSIIHQQKQRLEVIILIELPSVGGILPTKNHQRKDQERFETGNMQLWMQKSLRGITKVSLHVSMKKITSAEIQTEPCYHSLLMRKTTSANTSTLPLCYKLPFFSCFFYSINMSQQKNSQ